MQLTHPESDITTADWSKTPSGATNFAATLREYPNPDDANYVTSPNDPEGSPFEVKLWTPGWPKPLADGHKLRVRLRKTDSGSLYAGVYLLQGTKVIAYRRQALTATLATYTYTLSADEVTRITDYTDLRVRVVAGTAVVTGCSACATAPATWLVTLAGMANDHCSSCAELNGIYALTYDGGCGWSASFSNGCGSWGLELNYVSGSPDVWRLRLTNFADFAVFWVLDASSFECLDENEFPFAYRQGLPGFPETLACDNPTAASALVVPG